MPSITINNSSFETDAVNDGDRLEDSVTGWDLTANDVKNTGVLDPEAGDVSGVTGGQVAFLGGPTSTMSQQLTHTYSVTEEYTFTVDLGSDDGKGSGSTTYDVNLYAGGTLIGTTSGATINNGVLSTVTLTSTVVDPSLTGLPLTIEIVQDGDNELLIDNVTGEYNLRPADGIVQGTSGVDVFDVGDADVQGDLVDGADGLDDTIYTFQGDDDVKSGDGNDQIFLGSGNDKADGEDGNDIIYGQSGEDDLKGGLGDDVIYGDYAPDDDRGTLAEYDDKIDGEQGNDLIFGGRGKDDIKGGEDDDTVYGGGDNDKINGEDGNDVLVGEGGKDKIDGGDGNDLIWGDWDDGTDPFEQTAVGSGIGLLDGEPKIPNEKAGSTEHYDVVLTGSEIDANDISGAPDGPDGLEGIFFAQDPGSMDSDFTFKFSGGNGDNDGGDGEEDFLVFDLSQWDDDFNLNIASENGSDFKDPDVIVMTNAIERIDNPDGTATVTYIGSDGLEHTITIDYDNADLQVYGQVPAPINDEYEDDIKGGIGNDTIDGGFADDKIDGEAGDDLFLASTGNDAYVGGDGTDTYNTTGDDFGTTPSTIPDEVVNVTVGSQGIDTLNPAADFGTGTSDLLVDGSTDTFESVEVFIAGEDQIAGSGAASGTLTIDNASFEFASIPDGGRTENINGWDFDEGGGKEASAGTYDPSSGDMDTTTVDGQNVVYLDGDGASVSQQLSAVYDSENAYTFNVLLGEDDKGKDGNGPTDYQINVYAGTTLIGQTIGNTGDDNRMDLDSVVTNVFDPSLNGQPITIEIVNAGGDELLVDNVQGSFLRQSAPIDPTEDEITITNAVRPDQVTGIDDNAVGTFTFADPSLSPIDFGGPGQPTFGQVLAGDFGNPLGSWTITSGDESGTVGGIEFQNYETINFETVCFTAGTRIRTAEGEVEIETLSIGDSVLTLDHGYQKIRWIGSSHCSADLLDAKPNLRPIRIMAGVLGDGYPETDLTVSPQHRILVKSKIAERIFGVNEVLVPAKKLLDLPGVEVVVDEAPVEYFHMLFERHEIVWANGMPSESLYTGPQALQALPQDAIDEITTLFPDITDPEFVPASARVIPKKGKEIKNLVARHMKNSKAIYQPSLT